MLQKMRDQAQSLGAKIIVGVIIFVLTAFGFGAFSLFAVGERSVAAIDGDEIAESDLLTQVERERRRIIVRMGIDFDPSLIDENELRRGVLDRMIDRKILLQEAQRQSLAASPALIDEAIWAIPQFRAANEFNQEMARNVLSQMLHTPATFRREIEQDLRLGQLNDGVGRTGFITKAELSRIAALRRQKRDIAWLIIRAEDYAGEVSLSDEEVEADYQANLDAYVEPESVEVDYLELDLSEFGADAEVTELDLAAEYEAEKRARGGTEERRAAHILLEVTNERDQSGATALAQTLRQRALDGEDFADLAQTYSDDPGSAGGGGDLGYISRESEFDADFTDAVFALEADSISQPVVTAFGVHLIQVHDVRVRDLPTLAELRETLEERVRQRKAEESFIEARRKMEELAFEQFDSLDGVAAELGLEIRHAGPFSRDDGEGIAADARVRAAAYSDDVLVDGNNSSTINVPNDRAAVLRVVVHEPRRQLPLEEVTEQVRSRLRAKRTATLAEATGREAIVSLERKLATDLVAASLGRTWQVMEDATRFHGAVPGEVLSAAFELARPVRDGKSVGSARFPNGDFAIVSVSRVDDGTLDDLSTNESDALSRFLESEAARTEFEAFRKSLVDSAQIERS
ncbi:MAG: SurA N-terminal domain-containing protein [Pseudomonadales bacterium]